MTMENWLMIAVVIGALALGIYNLYSNGKRPTVGAVVGEVANVINSVDELTKAAREAVQAAEQLWNTGQIPKTSEGSIDPRFTRAFDTIKLRFPDLNDQVLEDAVEGAVFWLKYIAPAFMAKLPESMQFGVQGTGTGMVQGALSLAPLDVPGVIHMHAIDSGDSHVAKPTPESLSDISPQ